MTSDLRDSKKQRFFRFYQSLIIITLGYGILAFALNAKNVIRELQQLSSIQATPLIEVKTSKEDPRLILKDGSEIETSILAGTHTVYNGKVNVISESGQIGSIESSELFQAIRDEKYKILNQGRLAKKKQELSFMPLDMVVWFGPSILIFILMTWYAWISTGQFSIRKALSISGSDELV